MSSKKHTIKYESLTETHPNVLVQMKTLIPKWYKELKPFHNNEVIDRDNANIAITMKHCTPVLDSLTSGYAITLPYDIAVSYDINGNLIFSGLHDGEPLINRRYGKYSETFPKPNGYNKTELSWSFPAAITVPVGCSFILTHPLNRFDLPFLTLSGIIDGGYVLNAGGVLPFYIKEGFKGVIEKGTPIAQVIPFKHSRWTAEKSVGLLKVGQLHKESIASKIVNSWYKSTWWVKKKYD
jgi:hypothetical protein